MTTTTDPTALLAALEELHAFLWDEMEFFSDDTDTEHRWTTHALGQKHDDLVERFHDAYAAASPDLRRALAIGLAWLEAAEALPEGWSVFGVRMFSTQTDQNRYRATAYSDDHNAGRCDGYGPTPEAALLALADALRKERGA